MTTLGFILLIIAVLIILGLLAMMFAPFGWEDEEGFHSGQPTNIQSASAKGLEESSGREAEN